VIEYRTVQQISSCLGYWQLTSAKNINSTLFINMTNYRVTVTTLLMFTDSKLFIDPHHVAEDQFNVVRAETSLNRNTQKIDRFPN